MRTIYLSWLLLLIGFSHAAFALEINGFQFADAVRMADYDKVLKLNGAAMAERNFLPLYLGALYLPAGTKSDTSLLQGLSVCRVSLIWLMPEFSKENMQQYWRQAFQRAIDKSAYGHIADRVEKFIAMLDTVHRGDELTFDYIPDLGMRVTLGSKTLGMLTGVEFNRTLLGIWLGNSAPAEFRNALLVNLTH